MNRGLQLKTSAVTTAYHQGTSVRPTKGCHNYNRNNTQEEAVDNMNLSLEGSLGNTEIYQVTQLYCNELRR